MTEIGEGSKAAVQKTIASMGANNLVVLPGAAMSGGVSFGSGSRPTLTPEDGNQLAQQCPAISDFAPMVQTTGQLVYGRKELEDPVGRRHHAQLPQRPRLDRNGGGRRFFRPRRAQCQQGLHGRHHDPAGAFRQRVARGQGPADFQRRFPRHRRLVFQGRQHDGPRPGRRRRGPLDDDQVPPQRRVGQRRGQCEPDGKPGPDHLDQQPQQHLSELHGPVSFVLGRRAGRHPAVRPPGDRRQSPRQGRIRRADSGVPSARSRASSASGTTSRPPAKTTTPTTTSTSAT